MTKRPKPPNPLYGKFEEVVDALLGRTGTDGAPKPKKPAGVVKERPKGVEKDEAVPGG